VKKSQYTNIFNKVTGTPILTNSQKVRVTPDFFSAFWIIITLLAAPNIERLPAIVLPAASAMSPCVVTPKFVRTSKYRATRGTLEINWLNTTLTPIITGTEFKFKFRPFIRDWNIPEFQTLSMRMNMEAKKISVNQSTFFITLNRFGLARIIGRAPARAI